MKIIKNNLKGENIPDKFIKKFDGRLFGYVQLIPDTEPLHLIENLKGYWLTYEFGMFLRDEKDKLISITKKQAKIAKIRYLFNFKNKKKKCQKKQNSKS